ncbi:MAG: hypothetical protein PVG49_20685 [Desulfobacteraceae bacterium]|jgi:hypothetical protein
MIFFLVIISSAEVHSVAGCKVLEILGRVNKTCVTIQIEIQIGIGIGIEKATALGHKELDVFRLSMGYGFASWTA